MVRYLLLFESLTTSAVPGDSAAPRQDLSATGAHTGLCARRITQRDISHKQGPRWRRCTKSPRAEGYIVAPTSGEHSRPVPPLVAQAEHRVALDAQPAQQRREGQPLPTSITLNGVLHEGSFDAGSLVDALGAGRGAPGVRGGARRAAS